MSAEDLNNVTAIRNFVRKQVFPHYKLKEPGWNKWCVDPKSICKRCCKLTIKSSGLLMKTGGLMMAHLCTVLQRATFHQIIKKE